MDWTTANTGAPATAAVSVDVLTDDAKRSGWVAVDGVGASCQLKATPANDWNHASSCG